MTFELTHEQCAGQTLSAFTITLYGLGSFTFDVNTTHIENGAANFTLPLNGSDPMLEVCNLGGVVFGSNEVGNSTAENIQLPDGKQVFDKHDKCCYVYVFWFTDCLSVSPTSSHAAVATTTPTTAPPPTVASTTDTTEPSQSDPTIAVIGIIIQCHGRLYCPLHVLFYYFSWSCCCGVCAGGNPVTQCCDNHHLSEKKER